MLSGLIFFLASAAVLFIVGWSVKYDAPGVPTEGFFGLEPDDRSRAEQAKGYRTR